MVRVNLPRLWSVYLQREYTDNTSPSESNAAKTEKAKVQSICSSLNARKDFAVILRETRRNGLASFLCFLAKRSA